MKSLNQIVAKLKEIQESHPRLNSFYFGQLYNLGMSESPTYPLMAGTLLDSSINGNELNTRIALVFADLVNKGEENKVDVLSDQQRTALDVYALFADWCRDELITIQSDATLDDFEDRFNDEVSGFVMEFGFTQFYDKSTCWTDNIMGYLLLENSDYILLENGDKILL
jgi:hypothetical protein